MLLLLILSAALSFTLFRQPADQKVKTAVKGPAVVSDGFGKIMQAAGRIGETIELKHTVDSLTAKKQLGPADSVLLDSVLDRLQQIQTIK
ncbi:hypothetical protein ACFQZI_06520 [Mucilaginibacter lutimaris]|uniref:Uncharacterized protein n=1 Tax=Mucilaginibacter lutimaris TaxID=931629 RepID=A0ABW2ZE98_9SPHI